MAISTTINPEARRPAASRGFTLVETLVVSTIGGFILLGILGAHVQMLRSQVRISHYAEMEAQVRRGLEQLGLDLRSASAITWNNASDITLSVPLSGGRSNQVTYAWTSATRSLFRVPGADSAVTAGRRALITGIPPAADGTAGLTFARYTRDGVTAATDLATKRIVVTMNVRRQSTVMAVASENAASASFILRNKPAQ